MATLLAASPYGLVYNSLIEVRVYAYNSFGWSVVSDVAGALTVRTKPVKMNTPTRGSLTTTTVLHLDWVALTATADRGGGTITSYDFEWDAGT